MILNDSKIFCFEKILYNETLKFNSLPSIRYTIMSLLGLKKAVEHGYEINTDISEVYNQIITYQNSLTIGDYGLLLWLDYRLNGNNSDEIVKHIKHVLKTYNWDNLIHMELSWLITGFAYYNSTYNNKEHEIANDLFQYYVKNRISPSGLFYHVGSGVRRNFPNFASQIYGIHALSIKCRLESDNIAGEYAIKTTECLSKLQRENGGWPWIYDAYHGKVIEPFEIYSVHQDAMAPMAFHELYEATGFDTSKLINNGLKWLNKDNELRVNMIDDKTDIIYRSIRRKKPYDKISLYSRSLLSKFDVHLNRKTNNSKLEVNYTCRPYHLGWILEAWCGRE